MKPQIDLPPQPKLADFYLEGSLHRAEFQNALDAWRTVCVELVKVLGLEMCR